MENNIENKEMGMKFSPHKINSNVCCCVFGCKSLAKKNPTIRFHLLPNINDAHNVTITNKYNKKEVVSRRYAWERVLKMKKYSLAARVCSLHFRKDDYILPDIPAKARRLKKTAIPSLNLPATEAVTGASLRKEENNESRTQRASNRSNQKKVCSKNVESSQNIQHSCVGSLENLNNLIIYIHHTDIEQSAVLSHQDKEIQTTTEYKDQEIQVNI